MVARPWRLRRAPEAPSAAGWLRMPPGSAGDVAVKPAAYLPVYEELLGPLRDQPVALLELGVWKGDSLVLWRDALPLATIVGIDLAPPPLELGPRVHVIAGDQADGGALDAARAAHAPDGFDVIIDDASHTGQLSARSLQALYARHLKPGGMYIIEDWGTGYLPDWADGAKPTTTLSGAGLDERPSAEAPSMPSHDAGLVGLVKRLVDHTAAGTLAAYHPDLVDGPLSIEWMRVQDGMVILKKPAGAGR